MRRAALLPFLFLLCLGKIKAAVSSCGEECSSLTDVRVSEIEISIPFPGSFKISNVTFANGTQAKPLLVNGSISELDPGTQYVVYFTNGNSTCCEVITTKPSPVSDLRVESIGTTTVNLTWKSEDLQAINYTYRIEIEGNASPRNESSDTTSAVISNLEPGTWYRFNIYPVAPDNKTEGEPNNASLYTKPSPVSELHVQSVGTTTVYLTWKNEDLHATNYTYRIEIEGNASRRNESSDTTSAVISNLEPGAWYKFNIYPVAPDNKTEGEPKNASLYTKPSPVSELHVQSIGTTTVNLTWKNEDLHATNYTYRIEVEGNATHRNESSDTTSAVISNLEPGTWYRFNIYPVAPDNKTEGEPKDTSLYTKPSPVSDLRVESIGTTTVNLTWKNEDLRATNYTYQIEIESNASLRNESSDTTSAVISNLEPGTWYRFTVYPVAPDNKTEGEPKNTSLYTIPSSVFNISVTDISTTVVNLTWKNSDLASVEYFYRINVSEGAGVNTVFADTSAVISGLSPGTQYTFSIYSIAGDMKTEGKSSSINYCTIPASVDVLMCEPVAKQAELILNWTPPNGTFVGFHLLVLNNPWNKTLSKEYKTTVTNLSYFTNYTVQVITRSCEKESIPKEITCHTSITDPPPPSDPPAVKALNHYSLNVQFGVFNSTHGPVTAYAIVVTTSEGPISNDSLQYTYDEFIKKKTNTYVASIIEVQQKYSSSSNSQQYDMKVGDGSKVYGYVNGKLDPLGSYRVCVAGFTQMNLNETIQLINVDKSFLSFSPSSGTVVLPQNPDVITGAVVGCVLAAVIVAVIVGFIFWKKRRDGGKNSDVPFSIIESKSMKVDHFDSYFKKQKADSNCGFAEEYENLRLVGVNQPKFAAELPENKGKNRYNNVLPYEFSRVKLSMKTSPFDDYINANYMPGYNSKEEFIAAQGPLPTTVQDFWRMIWEKNIYAVVMLTKCVEQGRTKCEEYWPNKQSKSYGDIIVAMTSEIVLPEWTIRDFSMEKSDSSESHPVRQFHFTAWPDHGVPETTDLVISFRHLVQEYMKLHPTSPTLVHCSAGVGRTGTFIALDRLIHQMEVENTVDVYGVVYDLRMHRSLMVQTEDQYIFLNQCVLDIIKSKKEAKTDLIYQNTNAMAIYENFTPSPHTGKANGYHV
uniref:protein-tyrosine-phosphatase n=1 Tax=Pogona vitticeps TaxID=103695 RepID=A0ABM5F8R6_9SAUR